MSSDNLYHLGADLFCQVTLYKGYVYVSFRRFNIFADNRKYPTKQGIQLIVKQYRQLVKGLTEILEIFDKPLPSLAMGPIYFNSLDYHKYVTILHNEDCAEQSPLVLVIKTDDTVKKEQQVVLSMKQVRNWVAKLKEIDEAIDTLKDSCRIIPDDDDDICIE